LNHVAHSCLNQPTRPNLVARALLSTGRRRARTSRPCPSLMQHAHLGTPYGFLLFRRGQWIRATPAPSRPNFSVPAASRLPTSRPPTPELVASNRCTPRRYSADWPPLQCRHRPLARLPTTPVTSVRHGCHRHAQRRKENISIPHFHRHRHLARRPRLLLHTAVSRLQPPMGRITARQHFQQRAESSAPRSPQIPLYIQPAPPRSLPKAAAPSVRSKSPARLTAGRLAPGHLADSSSLSLRRFTDSPTASTSGRRALSRAASYGESFPPPTVKLESPPPHVVAHRIWPPLPPAAPECHELSALPCSC
jgi:hypothetical protein